MDEDACSGQLYIFDAAGVMLHPASGGIRRIGDMPPAFQTVFRRLRDEGAAANNPEPFEDIAGEECVLEGRRLLVLRRVLPDAVKRTLADMDAVITELEAVFNASIDGLAVADARGKLLRVNKSYLHISGVREEEIVGKTAHEINAEGIFSPASTEAAIELKKNVTCNQFFPRTGKSTINTSNPVFGRDGALYRIVTNIRDMEEVQSLRDELTESQGLVEKYSRLVNELTRRSADSGHFVSRSPAMEALYRRALDFADVSAPVLITGESGSGKELFADFIHSNSPRANKPLLKINCGAIPEQLLEAELFGYQGGAFTGAVRQGKSGLLELADKGTVFLDEVSEISPAVQVKLLRFVQNKEFYRLGGTRLHTVDVRIIAATNRNLAEMMEKKLFRDDLFYRLNVLSLCIPPLRERKEDIVPLAAHFQRRFNKQYGREKSLSPTVCAMFMHYGWPGNIRELENLMESLTVIHSDKIILPEDLPKYMALNVGSAYTGKVQGYRNALDEFEQHFWGRAMLRYKTCRQAAADLGVNHSTIVKKMKRYKLNFTGNGVGPAKHARESV
jgi:PAS domain S-box-containing protein